MKVEDAAQAIHKEMNRRRRHGGAEDVPALLWESDAVRAAVQKAAVCAQNEDFRGDWDYAAPELEEQMDALAKTLRRAAQQSAYAPEWRTGLAGRVPSANHGRLTGGDGEGWRDFQSRPASVRQDAGSRALADYLSWYLRNDGAAQYYRHHVCGGDTLTREEAWLFLTSSLPKVMSLGDYERLGLCPVRARGRILSKYHVNDGALCVTNMMMVDPSTGVPTPVTETLHNKIGNYCVEVETSSASNARRLERLVLNRNEHAYVYVCHLYSMPRPYRIADFGEHDAFYPPQPVPYFENEKRYVEGYSLTVMGELIGMAELFCEHYPVPIWDMLEAFLTGEFRPISAVEVFPWEIRAKRIDDFGERPSGGWKKWNGFAAQGPVTLTVQPWVTPEVLADAWREHRKQNACYSPSEKQAEAVQFVLSHTLPGEEFAWERLAGQWEEERGEMMTRGQLLKQFQRARAAILPGYRELGEG